MSTDPATIAETYFTAWQAQDFDRLRSLVADDVEFHGPLADIKGADEFVDGLKRMAQITTDIVVHKRFVDGDDVLTWFDLHTSVADPVPTANWTHVRDGKITAVRVAFDARELAP
jgi:ketosteroid isomerase-like protein